MADFTSPVRPVSLPSSSAPYSSNRDGNGTPARTRAAVADALDIDGEERGNERDEEDNDDESARWRRRAKGQMNLNVPIVKDAVGESVTESFETFLKKLVLLDTASFTN